MMRTERSANAPAAAARWAPPPSPAIGVVEVDWFVCACLAETEKHRAEKKQSVFCVGVCTCLFGPCECSCFELEKCKINFYGG